MTLKEFCLHLDSAVPLSFQENWDNSGLQTGDPQAELTSALLTLDVTEDVVDEAERVGCNVIVSHHPLIFSGIKKLTGQTAVERIVMKAIRASIAIYSAHTNLDSVESGVSWKMAFRMGLKNVRTLQPLRNKLLKLVTFVPLSHADAVKNAIFEAGAGTIGHYDNCAYTLNGTGSFRAGEGTNPFSGEKGTVHFEEELRIETVLYAHLKNRVVAALINAHPYEEVAYDLYALENTNINTGMGCIGELSTPVSEEEFISLTASVFGAPHLRYSRLTGKPVRKVAMCGGAGSSLLNDAISSGADVFITGDIKYHSYFEAENRILMVDAGHFETEKFTSEILYDLIIKKFPKFAVRFSGINTNPINYL
jgi:dinuclear metal center YbgI/SA1388 family protein